MADDDDTVCTLCFETYSDCDEDRIPRNLNCGHTYCTECMRNLRDNNNDEDEFVDFKYIDEFQSSIKCPQCKKMTEIRDGEIANLPKNYAFLNLMEKMKNLQVTAEGSRKYKCAQHSGEDLRYWCDMSECQKPVCSSCLLEGSHQGHMFRHLSEVSGTKRETLQERLAEAVEVTAMMEKGFESVATEIKNLCELGESAKEKIKEKFKGMRTSLDKREKELLGAIDSYIEDTQETLETQKQHLEEHLKRGRQVCTEVKTVADGHDLEVLTKFKQSGGQLWELVEASQGVVTEPLVRPVIRFRSETRDTIQQIESYGELCFEELKLQTQTVRTFEQGQPMRMERVPQVSALARRPLQRMPEKLAVESLSIGSPRAAPSIRHDPNWVTEAEPVMASHRGNSPPSSPPRRVQQAHPSAPPSSPPRRVQQAHPSSPPTRRDEERPQIPGLRMRSREPSQMSIIHTVTPSPSQPTPRTLPEVDSSHSPPHIPSWKERVSYVNKESDLAAKVDPPTDSYRVGRVQSFMPVALPPESHSSGGGSSSREQAAVQGEPRRERDLGNGGSDTAPDDDCSNVDIWSAALRDP